MVSYPIGQIDIRLDSLMYILLLHLQSLILMNIAGLVSRSRITQNQALFQFKQSVLMDSERMDDILIHPEFHEVESAENRGVLILPATGNTEVQPFSLKRQLRELMRVPTI